MRFPTTDDFRRSGQPAYVRLPTTDDFRRPGQPAYVRFPTTDDFRTSKTGTRTQAD